ncbi:MAG: ATP-dependent zinc metalloprotease FtsH [Lachnospiraceae bacterium]|nr:ATP-dependent zinc metalloprotease FtsH [Lachnospiraceae bacterium]
MNNENYQGPDSGGGRGNGNGNGNGGNNNKNGNGGNGSPGRQSFFLLLIATLITLMVMSFLMRSVGGGSSQEITYDEFLNMVKEDKVESVVITDSEIDIVPKSEKQEKDVSVDGVLKYMYGYNQRQGGVTYYTGVVDDDSLPQFLNEHGVSYKKKIPDNSGWLLSILLTYILPIVLVWVILSFAMRKMGGMGGFMGVGKSNAKVYVEKETGVTFKDVAGEDEAKESLQEVVDFLHNPAKYTKIGARLPKGALLVGPPGTGKTLLAKAVAGEAHVPFFSLAGSDFIELYVGVGASRVRDLFSEANKHAPCIIFIDEIDAIGRSRDSKFGGGNEEREQTLNQLLSEMDGFDSSKGILILGATNRPEILDKALLRPGRFDRRIIVDKPDLKGRVEILKVHAKDVHMDETVDLEEIALATSGAVGSDLANMINESAINAVKAGRKAVSQKDLFDAVEVVLVGKEKKDRIMSKEERRIVSYHEVGHALIAALQKNSEPVQKITIVPRTMGALGYVMQVPEEEKYLNSKAELHDMIVGLLGGRAAEELVFDTVTTGASNDIERATQIARSMVTTYGMSKRFGLMALESMESRYLDQRMALNCSDVTAAEIDDEVKNILKDCYKEAKKLLKDNRKVMDKIAARLIKQETITGKEFMQIFRKEKGLPEPEEKANKKKGLPESEEKTDKKKDKSGAKSKENGDVTAVTVVIDGQEEEIDLEKAYHQNTPDQPKRLSDDANSHTRFEAVVDDEKVKATSVREFTIIPVTKNEAEPSKAEPEKEENAQADITDTADDTAEAVTPDRGGEAQDGSQSETKKSETITGAVADTMAGKMDSELEKRFSEGAKLLDDLAATSDLGEDDE